LKTLSEYPGYLGRSIRTWAKEDARRRARRERLDQLAFRWRHAWLVRELRELRAGWRQARRFLAGFWRL
jgi:hypothetical protein